MQKVAKLVNLPEILEDVSLYSVSSDGARRVREMSPRTDYDSINRRKSVVYDSMRLISSQKGFSFNGWNDLGEIFAILKIRGSQISIEQAVDLAIFAKRVSDFRIFFKSEKNREDFPFLDAKVKAIPDLSPPLAEIEKIIDLKSCQIRELPTMKAIRAKITSIRNEITEIFKKFTTDSKFFGILQMRFGLFGSVDRFEAAKRLKCLQNCGIIEKERR